MTDPTLYHTGMLTRLIANAHTPALTYDEKFIVALAKERDSLRAETVRLRAIVDKLPKTALGAHEKTKAGLLATIQRLRNRISTADGVDVLDTEDMAEAWHEAFGELQAGDIAIGRGCLRVDFVRFYQPPGDVLHSKTESYPIYECYSTSEAAEAAINGGRQR